jgi:hypothetical protein
MNRREVLLGLASLMVLPVGKFLHRDPPLDISTDEQVVRFAEEGEGKDTVEEIRTLRLVEAGIIRPPKHWFRV